MEKDVGLDNGVCCITNVVVDCDRYVDPFDIAFS